MIISKRKSFTLIETLVSIAVLGIVMISAGGIFSSIRMAWQRQRTAVALRHNSRWAIKFITGEALSNENFDLLGGVEDGVRINPDLGNPIFFWRGNPTGRPAEDAALIYYGRGGAIDTIVNPAVLLDSVVNDAAQPVFGGAQGNITIELRTSRINREFFLSSQVRRRRNP